MGAKRASSVKKKMYIEIDPKALAETGEIVPLSDPISAPEITIKVPKGRFEIVYSAELFHVLRELGNKKIDVLSYILDHKDGYNQLNMSNTELAKTLAVSRPTVIETMKTLSDAGVIQRKGTVIMVSPTFMVKGNQIREAFLMRKYVEMSSDEEEEKEIIESEIDAQYKLTESGDIVQEVH